MAGNPGTYVLVTRPRAQGQAFAARLKARFGESINITQSPLLEIRYLDADLSLQGVGWLLFTSANGVRGFAALSERRDIPALCVGDRTAQMAATLGMTVESAAGTVDDLLELARARAGVSRGAFLYLRGKKVARPLVRMLRDAGLNAREAVVYEQLPRPMTPQARDLFDGARRVVVPLFSPRSANVFMEQVQGLDTSATTVVCISGNVADQLERARFGQVRIASAPNAAAVEREIAAII
ncbi:MAG: uroporphyrinogen-III synthase [Paracoccaceae bacterium]|nr:uroporphyrinogen-III synthase [Paracoccaceae bacterium]